jgi:hypothetical protein
MTGRALDMRLPDRWFGTTVKQHSPALRLTLLLSSSMPPTGLYVYRLTGVALAVGRWRWPADDCSDCGRTSGCTHFRAGRLHAGGKRRYVHRIREKIAQRFVAAG